VFIFYGVYLAGGLKALTTEDTEVHKGNQTGSPTG
jgi:hypothetical protein